MINLSPNYAQGTARCAPTSEDYANCMCMACRALFRPYRAKKHIVTPRIPLAFGSKLIQLPFSSKEPGASRALGILRRVELT
jgi:hypothetical protein